MQRASWMLAVNAYSLLLQHVDAGARQRGLSMLRPAEAQEANGRRAHQVSLQAAHLLFDAAPGHLRGAVQHVKEIARET